MLHLLKIEWLKVKSYKAFWIFSILYSFAILGINYTGYYVNELTVQSLPQSQVLFGSPYSFPPKFHVDRRSAHSPESGSGIASGG